MITMQKTLQICERLAKKNIGHKTILASFPPPPLSSVHHNSFWHVVNPMMNYLKNEKRLKDTEIEEFFSFTQRERRERERERERETWQIKASLESLWKALLKSRGSQSFWRKTKKTERLNREGIDFYVWWNKSVIRVKGVTSPLFLQTPLNKSCTSHLF